MAVSYVSLNRNQEFSTPQKAAIKKIFGLAEAAATGSDSTLVSRTLVHLALGGHFSPNAVRDIKALMREIQSAVDAQDNARDLNSTFGVMCMETRQRKILKTMANAVIAQVV